MICKMDLGHIVSRLNLLQKLLILDCYLFFIFFSLDKNMYNSQHTKQIFVIVIKFTTNVITNILFGILRT